MCCVSVHCIRKSRKLEEATVYKDALHIFPNIVNVKKSNKRSACQGASCPFLVTNFTRFYRKNPVLLYSKRIIFDTINLLLLVIEVYPTIDRPVYNTFKNR